MISEKRLSGDGSNKLFPVEFKILGEEFVRVYIDNVLINDVTTYDIINNSVVFTEGNAPASGTNNVKIIVATSVSDLDNLATLQSNVDIVANDIANVNTVAGDIANVNIVAGDTTNVNNVGNSIANVDTVAGSIANVNTVSGSIANVNITAGSIANVNNVGGSIAKVNNVSDNLDDVTNFADVYQGGKANDPTTRADASALQAGDLYFNTALKKMKEYDGSAWQLSYLPANDYLSVTNNLSDLDNLPTALVNLGLDNVDNTSDLDKPVSTATQTALDLKLNTADIATVIKDHATSFVIDHDATLAKIKDATETSDTTTAVYQVGDYVYNSTSGILYECILVNTIGILLTNATYFTAVTSNTLSYTYLNSIYTNGKGQGGYQILEDSSTSGTIDFSQTYLEPDGSLNPSTTDAVPTMTSNTAPSGVASASSIDQATYDAYKAFDGSTTTRWLTSSGTTTGWLQYQFTTSKIINKYTVAPTASARAPKTWTIKASNTGVFGGEEVILDTQTNITGWVNQTAKTFTFTNSNSYLYYRIDVTENSGDASFLDIGELQLIEAQNIPYASNGINYVAKEYNLNSFLFSTKRPNVGHYDKESADDNRPIYLGGKWYQPSSVGELVTNGNNPTDTTGWTTSSGDTLVVESGRFKLTCDATLANTRQALTLEIGETYVVRLAELEDDYTTVYIDGTRYIDSLGVNSANRSVEFEFVATSTSQELIIQLEANGVSGNTLFFNGVSVFKKQSSLGTEYTNPIAWFEYPYQVADNTPQVLRDDIESLAFSAIFENITSVGDIETKGKFIGKNACTALFTIDGVTTPPTMKDEYNGSDVVRISTGKFRIFFKEKMDNIDYNVTFNVGIGTGSSSASELTIYERTLEYFGINVIYAGVFRDADYIAIKVTGGKN